MFDSSIDNWHSDTNLIYWYLFIFIFNIVKIINRIVIQYA